MGPGQASCVSPWEKELLPRTPYGKRGRTECGTVTFRMLLSFLCWDPSCTWQATFVTWVWSHGCSFACPIPTELPSCAVPTSGCPGRHGLGVVDLWSRGCKKTITNLTPKTAAVAQTRQDGRPGHTGAAAVAASAVPRAESACHCCWNVAWSGLSHTGN